MLHVCARKACWMFLGRGDMDPSSQCFTAFPDTSMNALGEVVAPFAVILMW